jgi:molybdopterin molybdotransferase
MISFDDAVRLLGEVAGPVGTEAAWLRDAHGRVLAQAIQAQLASPRTDVATMDGYAVREGEAGSALRVIGESFPGCGFAGALAPGMAVRIFTGAPVPSGAGRVVVQENARREGDWVVVDASGGARNIRLAGSDFQCGERVLPAGTVLGPRALVAAAAADVAEVSVFRRPRLRVLATGDELAEPGSARGRNGAIPDSVSLGVAALARDWGAEPIALSRLPDDLASAARQARVAAGDADLLVVTGGASVGERDFAKAMFDEALEIIFSKVAIKPGKPVWLGRVGATLVIGLPGNPTSAMVTARLLLAPLIAGLTGRDPVVALDWRRAPLAEPIEGAGDRETFARARWDGGRVRPLPGQDSGAQKMLADAELLVRRPAGGSGLAAGELIDILAF